MTADWAHLAARTVASDDLNLVHASKDGDVAAFEQLVKRYDRKLFRIAQHITHNWEDAEDAVQEAFLKAFQHFGRIPRGLQIFNLADSHYFEPVAYEAAKAAVHNK